MKFADLLLENVSTSLTNAGTVTLIGAPAGYRTLAKAIEDGDLAIGDETTFKIADESGNWEFSTFRVTNNTTLTRVTIHRTSNGSNFVVTFPVGPKTIMNSPNAEFMSSLVSDSDPVVTVIADLSTSYLPVIGSGGKSRISAANLANAISKEPSTLPTLESAVVDSDQLFVLRAGEVKLALASVFKTYTGGVADTTAPTLSSPTGAQTGTTTASGSVTTNEPNGTLYYLATVNATETVATVKASGASKAVTATGSQAVTVSGLSASTQYYLHFVQRDAAGNDSTRVTSSPFTTAAVADTTAPTLSSPTGTQTGSTTANLSVSTNEANGTLYRYVSTNAVESVATVKAANLTQAVTATGVQNATASGLTANTQYFAHFVHRDASGNDSLVASSAGFTTASAGDTTAPTLTSPTGTKTGTTTASGTVSTNEANGTLYFLASTSATVTAAAVKAGSSQAVSATGVQNVAFSGLTAGAQYYAHYLQADAAGNESAVVTSSAFTTDAAATRVYTARTTVTPGGAAITGAQYPSVAGTWVGGSTAGTDKYVSAATAPVSAVPRIKVVDQNGIAPSVVKFVWGNSPTVAPNTNSPNAGGTPLTYATSGLPAGMTGNIMEHTEAQGGFNPCAHHGNWTDGGGTAQSYYGVFAPSGSLYAWRNRDTITSQLVYLWIYPDDGSAPFVYDNGTGTAIGWQVNV
jgi:DUF971 family protein